MPLEIACFHKDAVPIAFEAGADRIELCEDYIRGGLTPKPETLASCFAKVNIPVHGMLRNRPDNFIYSAYEKDQMLDSLEMLLSFPISGIVTGALTNDLTIDRSFIEKVRSLLPKHKLIFHRAFDLTPDWKTSLKQLITLEVDAILTSGGTVSALNNLVTLKAMHSFAGESIELICGGGVRTDNIKQIKEYTGIRWMHSAAIRNRENLLPDATEIKQMKECLR